jgi:hypothetical protein
MNVDATPPPARRAASRVAGLWLVVAFTILAGGYALVVPVFAAPDEPFHFEYVRYLAQHAAMPDQTDAQKRISSEGMGPPLYYALAAVVLRVVDPDVGAGIVLHDHLDIARFVEHPSRGMPERLRPPLNPHYVKWRQGEEPNMFLRMPEDRFPYRAPAGAIHWLRMLSVLCGAGTVWLVYRTAGLVWPDRPDLAVIATALVAFDPQFAFLSGSINNDNGVILLASAALHLMTRLLVATTPRIRDEAWLGVVIGAALIVKTNAVVLLPLALGVLVWTSRGRGGWRAAWPGALRVSIPVVLIAGWFFVRGVLVYGLADPLGMTLRAAQNPDLVLPPEQRAHFFFEVFGQRLFQSWWGLFDWVTLPMPGWLYVFYGLLMCFAAAGAIVRLGTEASVRERTCSVLYAAAFALSLAALVALNFTFHSAQSRLLFPAIVGVAIVLAGGLDTAIASVLRERAGARVRRALPILLAVLSAGVLFGVVGPAYP